MPVRPLGLIQGFSDFFWGWFWGPASAGAIEGANRRGAGPSWSRQARAEVRTRHTGEAD